MLYSGPQLNSGAENAYLKLTDSPLCLNRHFASDETEFPYHYTFMLLSKGSLADSSFRLKG